MGDHRRPGQHPWLFPVRFDHADSVVGEAQRLDGHGLVVVGIEKQQAFERELLGMGGRWPRDPVGRERWVGAGGQGRATGGKWRADTSPDGVATAGLSPAPATAPGA